MLKRVVRDPAVTLHCVPVLEPSQTIVPFLQQTPTVPTGQASFKWA